MSPSIANLSYDDLRQLELRLFADIRRLGDVATQLRLPQVEALQNLQALIADNKFSIAVVGEFKRGKSTFINALLREEVLPAAIEACSATLNRITYGRAPRARIVLHGDGPPDARTREVPLDQLADYVTKLTPEARQMSAAVEEAVISFPSHFCRNNVDLIDTPGLNDDDVMTRITLEAVARVNAAILVIRASIPFGESEQRLLEKLLDENIGTILFVVTAIDEIAPEHRERLVAGIKTRIKRAVKAYASEMYDEEGEDYRDLMTRFAEPRVYGVSGYQALEAQREKNVALEYESGLPAFEQLLETLLAAKDGAESVRQVARRLTVAAEEVARQIESRAELLTTRLVVLDRCAAQAQEALAALTPQLQMLRTVKLAPEGPEAPEPAPLLMRMKVAAASRVEQLSLDLEHLVHTALAALRDPQRPFAVAPEVRAKLERVASYNPTLDVEPIVSLARQAHAAVLEVQRAAIAAAAEDVRGRLAAAYEQGLLICAAADATVAATRAGLEVVWPEHPVPPVASAAALQQCLEEALAALATWADEATAPAVVLQVQPPIVALRTAMRVFPADPHATPPLAGDEAIAQFSGACIRSMASDIDMAEGALRARLSQLIATIAEPAAAELRRIPARTLGSLLDSESGMAVSLQRARIRLEGRTEAEQGELELRQSEVRRIEVQARQLLVHLRGEELS